MIGFVTTSQKANAVLSGISQAMLASSGRDYWTCGAYLIHSGPYAGQMFLPFDELMRSQTLRLGKRAEDFPQFPALLNILGGLDDRVDVDPADIVDPNADAL